MFIFHTKTKLKFLTNDQWNTKTLPIITISFASIDVKIENVVCN